ncbi:uncharacterized protein BO96DRAFT_246467 [Aspergillus niger CBS 101883]|uniref:uncharacterized protein n=1 Tax=Aspergillus lacticoffeatus (strain CBS 101883) TaxID=1450533 RepID=UPI000D801BAD|nr:uncharacterized protein BO96DRAFT_246467 [Aspergillus niger CBS 101883]PYH58687.1 hypothetical protein BO96DRAFT_246467 [Aspergillus niger CBS 101883]
MPFSHFSLLTRSRSRYHQFGRVQDTHLEAKVPTPRLSSKCEVDRFHPIPRVQSIVGGLSRCHLPLSLSLPPSLCAF